MSGMWFHEYLKNWNPERSRRRGADSSKQMSRLFKELGDWILTNHASFFMYVTEPAHLSTAQVRGMLEIVLERVHADAPFRAMPDSPGTDARRDRGSRCFPCLDAPQRASCIGIPRNPTTLIPFSPITDCSLGTAQAVQTDTNRTSAVRESEIR
jgi:hypothetical protein